jgi:hypothetical protein
VTPFCIVIVILFFIVVKVRTLEQRHVTPFRVAPERVHKSQDHSLCYVTLQAKGYYLQMGDFGDLVTDDVVAQVGTRTTAFDDTEPVFTSTGG